MSRIAEYRQVAPQGTVDIIERLAERVRGRRLLHVSGSRLGGGSAEVLRATVPILGDLGIDTRWEITGGDPAYYATVRALQAALEGGERVLTEDGLERYLAMNRVSARKLDLEADLVLAHDVPPASLVEARTGGRWIWRCHFDCAGAQHGAWVSRVNPNLGPGVKERMQWVSTIDAREVGPAKIRRENIARDMNALLADGAVLVLPTVPGIAPFTNTPAAETDDFRGRALSLLSIAGLARLPQVSLPVARVEGCPLGLSLVAARGGDMMLLALARRLEIGK